MQRRIKFALIYRSFYMAKATNSKSEVKKLQKEIAVLKNQLKLSEKRAKDSKKNWDKKHKDFQKDLAKRVAAARMAGFDEAHSELTRRESARRKAIQNAESLFEKEYGRKPKGKVAKKSAGRPKSKATAKSVRGSVKGKSQVKAAKVGTKAIKKTKAVKAAKTKRSASVSKGARVKVSSEKVGLKRRGRPSKKLENQRQSENQVQENYDVFTPETSEGWV